MATSRQRWNHVESLLGIRLMMLWSVGFLLLVEQRAVAAIVVISPGVEFIGHSDQSIPDPANANTNTTAKSSVGAVTLDGALFVFAPWGSAGLVVTDFLGHLLYVIDPLGRSVNLGPSPQPLATISDAGGNVTRFSYDSLGHVASVQAPNGNVTQYQYDSLNRLAETHDPANLVGTTVQYQYDSLNNRLQTVTEPGSQTTTFAYDTIQRLSQTTEPASMITQYQYDSLNRLIQRTDPDPPGPPGPPVTTYSYDSNGNFESQTTNPGNLITQYMYDSLNRLTQRTDPGPPVPPVTTYSYDFNGNLTQTADNPNNRITTYIYDAGNRLTQITDANQRITMYSYDANGQLSSINDTQFGASQFTAVPEPSSFVLYAIGSLIALATRRWRQTGARS